MKHYRTIKIASVIGVSILCIVAVLLHTFSQPRQSNTKAHEQMDQNALIFARIRSAIADQTPRSGVAHHVGMPIYISTFTQEEKANLEGCHMHLYFDERNGRPLNSSEDDIACWLLQDSASHPEVAGILWEKDGGMRFFRGTIFTY